MIVGSCLQKFMQMGEIRPFVQKFLNPTMNIAIIPPRKLFKKFRKINSQNAQFSPPCFLAKISNESIFIYYQKNLSDRPELYTFDWDNCQEMAQ